MKWIKWIKTSENTPEETDFDVIGFKESWIDEDFNPRGIRVCCHSQGGGWVTARWSISQYFYDSDAEEEDRSESIPEKWTPIIIPNHE